MRLALQTYSMPPAPLYPFILYSFIVLQWLVLSVWSALSGCQLSFAECLSA